MLSSFMTSQFFCDKVVTLVVSQYTIYSKYVCYVILIDKYVSISRFYSRFQDMSTFSIETSTLCNSSN
jgi:hypothetical protein